MKIKIKPLKNRRKIRRIIIEGVDKVGKDFLGHFMNTTNDYKYFIKTRDEISQGVYSKGYNRPIYEPVIRDDTLYVLLICSDDNELKYRLSFDTFPRDVKEMIFQQNLFKEYFMEYIDDNKIIIDISKITLPDQKEKILEKIKELEK